MSNSLASPSQCESRDLLLALAERCEREEPSIDLDAAIYLGVGKINFEKQATWNAPIVLFDYARLCAQDVWQDQFTRNLEAAARLVPGWYWRVGHGSENAGWAHLNRLHPDHCDRADEVSTKAKTPALALCAAALRARAALATETAAGEVIAKRTNSTTNQSEG